VRREWNSRRAAGVYLPFTSYCLSYMLYTFIKLVAPWKWPHCMAEVQGGSNMTETICV
jgi:hypothetical protein